MKEDKVEYMTREGNGHLNDLCMNYNLYQGLCILLSKKQNELMGLYSLKRPQVLVSLKN